MTTNKARKTAIRRRMAATGEPYTVAARQLADDLPPRRTATATAAYTATGRYTEDQGWTYSGWRLTIHDPQHDDREVPGPAWTIGAAWNDRSTAADLLGSVLAERGWTATGWPDGEVVPVEFTIPLRRNDLGLREDEADELYAAAGVTWATAHRSYIDAVASAVAAAGVPVCEVIADSDQPRGGSFRIGEPGDIELDPHTGWGPALYMMWREDRGWYEVGFSDAQKALGDYDVDLPGRLGVVAPPAEVAAAVLQRVEADQPPDPTAEPWTPPPGYDPDPPQPDNEDWDISPAFERSLLAYVDGNPTRTAVIV